VGEILPLMHVMAAVGSGDLVEGEGMALINGSPCATALAADVTLHAGNRLRLAEAIFALSIEALAAPLDAYDEALDDLRGDEAVIWDQAAPSAPSAMSRRAMPRFASLSGMAHRSR
jgi:histidine ammonia-lyase